MSVVNTNSQNKYYTLLARTLSQTVITNPKSKIQNPKWYNIVTPPEGPPSPIPEPFPPIPEPNPQPDPLPPPYPRPDPGPEPIPPTIRMPDLTGMARLFVGWVSQNLSSP